MHKMDAACRIGVTAALLLFRAGPALSQQVPPQLLPELQDDIRSNETLQSRFDRRGLIEPIEIGPFLLATQVQGDVGFNDNIFAQSTGQKADFFFDLGLKGVATYHNEAFSAELDTYFLDHQYVSLTTENYWETNNSLTLREAPTPDFNYFLDSGLQRLAVPRTDPNPLNGRTPATYLLYSGLGGVTFGSGLRNLLTLSVGFDKTQFDQIQPLTLDAPQRNRTEVFGDFRLDHVFFGQQKVFVELRPDTRNYDQDIDTARFRQASNGGRIDTGVQLEPNGVFP
ncbi:MAG: outer membrane beta-barrel protein [Aliidongia sp.]